MKKLFVTLALLVGASAVFAQDYYGLQEYGLRKNTTRVEIYGGMVLPQGGWKDRDTNTDLGKTGWSGGIGFQRNIVPLFSLGLDANYAQLGDSDKKADKSYYRTGVATGLVTGRLNLFPAQATRLYVPFGVGVGHAFTRYKMADGSHKTTSSTDLAQMLGLGLEFDIDESVIFGLEGRYYLVSTGDDFRQEFGRKHLHYIDVLLKFGFRF